MSWLDRNWKGLLGCACMLAGWLLMFANDREDPYVETKPTAAGAGDEA